MFFSSWAVSLMIGASIFGVAVLSAVASSVYLRMLGGKPLPALTQLILDIHHKPGAYIFAIVVVIVATHAFAVHLAVSRTRDVSLATWAWLSAMTATALVTTVYVGLSILALLLPLVSFPGGMVQPSAEAEAAEFRAFLVFIVLSLGALAYALFLGRWMWRGGITRGTGKISEN